MLVFTRRVREQIVIDGRVRIVVLESHRDRVRLGIMAPHEVRVDRAEVHDRRLREFPPEIDGVITVDRHALGTA